MNLDEALQLALTHQRAGRNAEAAEIYRRVLAVHPGCADGWHLLGMAVAAMGGMEEGAAFVRRAIELSPREASFRANLGGIYLSLERVDEAITCLREAIALGDDGFGTHENLGRALATAGRFEEAMVSLRRVAELNPNSAQAHYNLGTIFSKLGRAEEAIASLRRALAIEPGFCEALCNLGEQLAQLESFDEAMECQRRAIALRPDFAHAHNNLGNVLARLGRTEEADESLRRALAIDPSFATAHWNHSMVLFRLGRWEEAWREYEWRWQYREFQSVPRNFSQPQWRGETSPDATILIHCEQGAGDAIQFLRYVPFVRDRSQAARVILECPGNLRRLFATEDDLGAEIVETGVLPPFDLHVPLLSLPLALGRYEPLAISRPYLRSPHANEESAALRVGLAWAGNPTHRDDRKRSIEPAQFASLLPGADAKFFSLQVGRRNSLPGLIDLTEQLTDFADTAALMAKLDLVITVDTAVAHLGGALGKPVWVLLPFLPDWRWGLEGEGTPWYPTMRLFRQRTAGDWDEVIGRVATALKALPR